MENIPEVVLPQYEIKIPSSGKELLVRPFTVKEEKILLMANESKSVTEVVRAVKDTIKRCIVSGTFDVDKAPYFDVDYILVFLRARSIGEQTKLTYRCRNRKEGQECGGTFQVKFDLGKYEIRNLPENLLYSLDSKTKVKLKFPSYSVIKAWTDSGTSLEKRTMVLSHCVDYIQVEHQKFTTKEFTPQQFMGWFDTLSLEKFQKLDGFLDSLPNVVFREPGVCSKCGGNHNIEVSDFLDFFL